MRGLPGLAERPFSPNPSLPGTASSHTSPVCIILTASSTPGSTFSLRAMGEPREPRELIPARPCNPCAMMRSAQGKGSPCTQRGKARATGPAHHARTRTRTRIRTHARPRRTCPRGNSRAPQRP
eukprot:scaffold93162_cov69-Phaeocystis_antarctica.AAC.1